MCKWYHFTNGISRTHFYNTNQSTQPILILIVITIPLSLLFVVGSSIGTIIPLPLMTCCSFNCCKGYRFHYPVSSSHTVLHRPVTISIAIIASLQCTLLILTSIQEGARCAPQQFTLRQLEHIPFLLVCGYQNHPAYPTVNLVVSCLNVQVKPGVQVP